MDKHAYTVESFFPLWNDSFPNHTLGIEDLKKPHSLMRAVFTVLECLDIDKDAILSPPENRTENFNYYGDLLPVINTMRVVNYIIAPTREVTRTVNIMIFLQPSVVTSHSLLFLIYNFMRFKNSRMSEVAPFEDELFSKSDKINELIDIKNKLIESLNKQVVNKMERADRLKNLDQETRMYEEELKLQKEGTEKQEVEAILKEIRELEIMIEQKMGQKDTLMSEIEKKKLLRVYDADDVRAQVEQTARNVQDAEEKLSSLGATLRQKENNLMNLQSIKANLDIANNLLHEIKKLSDSSRDYENGDQDGKEDEQDKLNAELSELESQFAEISLTRSETSRKRQEIYLKRQQERSLASRNLREAEERDVKLSEKCKNSAKTVVELQKMTTVHEEEKARGLLHISEIKENLVNNLETMDEALMKVVRQSKEKVLSKLSKRNM